MFSEASTEVACFFHGYLQRNACFIVVAYVIFRRHGKRLHFVVPVLVLHDYCEKDFFPAECPPGQIIIIEEARYGRMELGSCIIADFGYLNCYR